MKQVFRKKQVATLTSLGALTSAPLFISISATLSPSLIRAAMCNGVSSACKKFNSCHVKEKSQKEGKALSSRSLKLLM